MQVTWNVGNNDFRENKKHIDAVRMPISRFLQFCSEKHPVRDGKCNTDRKRAMLEERRDFL